MFRGYHSYFLVFEQTALRNTTKHYNLSIPAMRVFAAIIALDHKRKDKDRLFRFVGLNRFFPHWNEKNIYKYLPELIGKYLIKTFTQGKYQITVTGLDAGKYFSEQINKLMDEFELSQD